MARNEKINTAKELYKKGMKLIDIAKELDIPPGTIRRWKSTYGWDTEENERSVKKANKEAERSVKKANKTSERSVKKNELSDKKTQQIQEEIEETLNNSELTDKQRMFCMFYVRTFNATQSYMNAYGGSYNNAMVSGCKLLRNPKIKAELEELKRMKMEYCMFGVDDLVEYHMRIAFADIGNYLTFGREMKTFYTKDGGEVEEEVNEVKLKDSNQVDTQLIKEIKEGRDGISIKLVDKGKSLDWLDKYFLVHPMDKHKIEYDNKKLAIMQPDLDTEEIADDGFLDALNGSAKDDWREDE